MSVCGVDKGGPGRAQAPQMFAVHFQLGRKKSKYSNRKVKYCNEAVGSPSCVLPIY